MRYEFATPEPPRLRLTIASGGVSIETGETGETVVEVDGDPDDVRVEQHGREIAVEPMKRFGRGRSRPEPAQHLSTPSTTFVAEGSAAAPVLAPLGTAPVLRSGAARTVGVRLASSRAPPARRGC